MASRLKYAWPMLAGCVLVTAVIQLTHPRNWDWINSMGGSPIARELSLANSQHNAAQRLYGEYVIMDTVLPRLPRTNGIVVEGTPLSADSTVWLSRLVNKQLAGVAEIKARVGVFVIPPHVGTHGGGVSGSGPRALKYFTGIDAAGPYCAIAVRLQGNPNKDGRFPSGIRYLPNTIRRTYYEPATDILGPCLLWAKYGAPGPRINDWLNKQGYRVASGPAGELWDHWQFERTDLFGLRYYNGSLAGAACRAGKKEQCVVALTKPYWSYFDEMPSDSITRVASFSTGIVRWEEGGIFGRGESGLLAHAEIEFGHEKFSRFWTSSQELEPAFQAAFGVPLADWLYTTTRAYFGTYDKRPPMSLLTVFLSLLLLAALVYITVRLSQDRQVY